MNCSCACGWQNRVENATLQVDQSNMNIDLEVQCDQAGPRADLLPA
jgi:hypothetical protein